MQNNNRISQDDLYFVGEKPNVRAKVIKDSKTGDLTIKHRSTASDTELLHEGFHVGTNVGRKTDSDPFHGGLSGKNFILEHNNKFIPDINPNLTDELIKYLGGNGSSQEFQARAKTVLDKMREFDISINDLEKAFTKSDFSDPKISAFLDKYYLESNFQDLLKGYVWNSRFYECLRHVWSTAAPIGIATTIHQEKTGGKIMNYLMY